VEKEKLQQPMNKDNVKEFFQELFGEEPICSVIPQCPRLRTKDMMKMKRQNAYKRTG
jgi:hypothetical protein